MLRLHSFSLRRPRRLGSYRRRLERWRLPLCLLCRCRLQWQQRCWVSGASYILAQGVQAAATKSQVQCTAREPTHPRLRRLRLLRLHSLSLRRRSLRPPWES